MKVVLSHLRRLVDLPEEPRAVRSLLDDVGIEVKRALTDPALGVVFTVELLANRGDHYAYGGIAREVHARTGGALRLPSPKSLPQVTSGRARVTAGGAACLAYSLTPLQVKSGTGKLPAQVSAVVQAAELASELPIVDVTNFVNLELGQPLHAFDAAKVIGDVEVRFSRAGETAWLLATKEPTPVPEGTLVIADQEKILAIAGVIGCEDSAMTAASQAVLLEAATFDPVLVRKASRALNVATDAAARFMRGGDPTLPAVGATRAIEILVAAGIVAAPEALEMAARFSEPGRVLTLGVASTNHFIGAELSRAEMSERLGRHGFSCAGSGDELLVTVPPHRRWDVEEIADVHEELAKSVGYGALKVSVPVAVRGASPSAAEALRRSIDEVIVGYGFHEIFTSGFYGRSSLTKLELPEGDPLLSHVETINALDRDYTLLKNNALVHALETVGVNLDVRLSDVRAFEWTRTFHLDANAENGFSRETELFWLVAAGAAPGSWRSVDGHAPLDFFFLRGVLDELRLATRVDLRLDASVPHRLDRLFHPQRRASILVGDAVVGILGEPHPAVLRGFRIKHARPAYLEIEWRKLVGAAPKKYTEPPVLMPARRDLCFDVPRGITADAIVSVMRGLAPPMVASFDVTDVFEDKTRRSVTFAVGFHGGEATTNVAMNETCQKFAEAVSAKWVAEGVKLRG